LKLARELQDHKIVKDRFAASKLISSVVDRGSLVAGGKWLIHPDRTPSAFDAHHAA
jgi:hypothetical protein